MVLIRRFQQAPRGRETAEDNALKMPATDTEEIRTGCPVIILGTNSLYRMALESRIRDQLDKRSTEAVFFWNACAAIEAFDAALDGLPETQRCSVILLMLGEGGDLSSEIRKITAILAINPATRIIYLASSRQPGSAARCIESGVCAYILSDISEQLLIDCISVVASGHLVYPCSIHERNGGTEPQAVGRPSTGNGILRQAWIDDSEARILACFSQGMSNKDISRLMGFTDSKTKLAVRKLLSKIGAKNRVQAAVWAKQNGYSADE